MIKETLYGVGLLISAFFVFIFLGSMLQGCANQWDTKCRKTCYDKCKNTPYRWTKNGNIEFKTQGDMKNGL